MSPLRSDLQKVVLQSGCQATRKRQEELMGARRVPASLVVKLGELPAALRAPSGPRGSRTPAPPPSREPRAGRLGLSSRPSRRVGRGGSDHCPAGCERAGLGVGPPVASVLRDGRASCVPLCPRPDIVFLQGPGLWDQSHPRASLSRNLEPLPEVPGFRHQHTSLGGHGPAHSQGQCGAQVMLAPTIRPTSSERGQGPRSQHDRGLV